MHVDYLANRICCCLVEGLLNIVAGVDVVTGFVNLGSCSVVGCRAGIFPIAAARKETDEYWQQPKQEGNSQVAQFKLMHDTRVVGELLVTHHDERVFSFVFFTLSERDTLYPPHGRVT